MMREKISLHRRGSAIKTMKEKCITRRDNKGRGFTMVELLVVLAILAIIAAVAVPMFLGFTDDAKEKQYVEEAKRALTASQTMLSDAYTENLKYLSWSMRGQAFENSNAPEGTAFTIFTKKNFQNADGTSATIAAYTISEAVYKTDDNQYIYYDGNTWEMISATRASEISAQNTNIIRVWPRGEEKDSASNYIPNTQAEGDDTPEDPYIEDAEDRTHINGESVTEEEAGFKPDIKKYVWVKFTSDDSVTFPGEDEHNFLTKLFNDGTFEENPSPRVTYTAYSCFDLTQFQKSVPPNVP